MAIGVLFFAIPFLSHRLWWVLVLYSAATLIAQYVTHWQWVAVTVDSVWGLAIGTPQLPGDSGVCPE